MDHPNFWTLVWGLIGQAVSGIALIAIGAGGIYLMFKLPFWAIGKGIRSGKLEIFDSVFDRSGHIRYQREETVKAEWRRNYPFSSAEHFAEQIRVLVSAHTKWNVDKITQTLIWFLNVSGLGYQEPQAQLAPTQEYWTKHHKAVMDAIAFAVPPADPQGLAYTLALTPERLLEEQRQFAAIFAPLAMVNSENVRQLLEQLRPPTQIPSQLRFQHTYVIAPPGTGKTNLLSNLIDRDLARVARGECSVIVMESKATLVQAISKLKDFAPGGALHGKLAWLDIEDVGFPLALNLFALSGAQAETERDDIANRMRTISNLTYVLQSLLGADITSRLDTMLSPCIELCLKVPGANIESLQDLALENWRDKFGVYVPLTDERTQRYFSTTFIDKTDGFVRQTKQLIDDRVNAMLRNPVLRRLFMATENKINFFDLMNRPNVILINASNDMLQDTTEAYQRLMIALIYMAALRRRTIPEDQRFPCYFYLDEAQTAIPQDPRIVTILEMARDLKLGMTIAHPLLDKMSQPVLNALFDNTGIKFAAGVHDARLAKNMDCHPDFIYRQPEHTFAVYARRMPSGTIKFPKVDFTNRALHMSHHDYLSQQHTMRQRFAYDPTAPKWSPPPPAAPPPPTSPPSSKKNAMWTDPRDYPTRP